MATKSISADVQAANSKLAQFMRRQEQEEMILQIGKRKPKQAREKRLPGGSGRWQLEPDWKAPTPMVDRPRTVAGSTSFHFSYSTISKSGVPTVNGSPVEGSFGVSRSPALDHSKYIERVGAAETSRGADHAGYIERPEAVESIDPTGQIAEQRERSISHIVNETPTEDEASLLGIEAIAPEGIPSVFSNISDDPFERQEFWRAVERMEATPRKHSLILEPDVGADWWASLATDTLLPADFRAHALNVAEAYRQHVADQVAGESRRAFDAKPFRATAEQTGAIIAAAQRMPTYRDWAPPFQFKSGRGGRVQFRMVAELPHELTAEDRALIVQNFCDHLGGLEDRRRLDGTPYKTGMMYTAVIHAPDAHNDSRNYHLHIVAYDRPCEFIAEQNSWDFEIARTYRDPGSGKDRVHYPHRQNKIGEVTQGSSKTNKEQSGRDFIPGLRAKFAEINNAVLKARGIRRRLDPRKYSEMGIDRTPTQHLGTKAAALEAIGISTTVGQLNALAIWSDAERAIKRQAAQASKLYTTGQADLARLLHGAAKAAPKHGQLADLRALVVERERLIKDVADDREAIMTFDHMEAKAKSRAIRTRQTCLQFLADIENGRADRNTKAMRLIIQDRWTGAQQHIETIDRALAPHRDALAKAARSIETREKRIVEIDQHISPLAETFRRLAAAAQLAQPAAPQFAQEVQETKRQMVLSASRVPAVDAPQLAPTADTETTPAETVELEALSIEGLPIVEPTIAPRPVNVIVSLKDVAATPEGLAPLRSPVPEASAVAPKGDVVSDLDHVIAGPMPAPAVEADTIAEPNGEADGPNASEPKVDRSKNTVEPALVDLPTKEAPAKPSTSRADYADFDALIDRIMDQRVPIACKKPVGKSTVFTVPSLSQVERDILANPRFVHRANLRLAGIHAKQGYEIQRLIRWITSAGQDANLLKLESRSTKLGDTVKVGVRTLFDHWGSHPDVIAALRIENERRVELAKAEAVKPKPSVAYIEKEREARRAEADRLYPTADQAFTDEVAAFIKLLRDAAPAGDLQKAADEIHASARAREDIHRHNVHLATAYRQYVEGVDHRSAQQRDHGRSRGD